ncbi:MAG: hypothetical protein DA330_06835 [Nitrososphaera sp.]|nr:hypothetical protein [Nitrososphaera sp.]
MIINSKDPANVKVSIIHRIEEMIELEDPGAIGSWKKTKYGSAFVTNLNDSYRLSFLIHREYRIIQVLRVGDHKQVYGKD